MAGSNPYARGLDRNAAHHVPLSPLSFIERAALVYPQRRAIVYGDRSQDWRTTYTRCRRLASALARRGVGPGDTVAAMLPNVPAVFEVDDETAPPGARLGELGYEQLLDEGDPAYAWQLPADEWDAIALNYTSGTTGNPKGVVTHHRGAYLNAANNVIAWSLPHHAVYLWTLPMFHCNGWCFPWTLALVAGTSVCLRRVSAKTIFDALVDHDVTHMCGAPIIMQFIIGAAPAERRPLKRKVEFMTAAAPPPAAVLEALEKENFRVTHVYGLTEVYGPATICAWDEGWESLPSHKRAQLKARQGVRYA